MQSLMILGRQPALGLAELESLYGAEKLTVVGRQGVIVDVDPCLLAFDRLGGSIKFCKLLTSLDFTEWSKVEKYLIDVSPGHVQNMPAGKMTMGLSLYGFDLQPREISASSLKLKKAIQKTGRSVRIVPNKTSALSSAQVIHNKLTAERGWELVFVRDKDRTFIAQTIKEQAIEAYTLRDRNRPKRDARVGMLPPKLAQIIVNLAVGKLPEDKLESICEIPVGAKVPRPYFNQTILDPFCGTGVILQEAALMGYESYGTDLDQRMTDYAKTNLEWLAGRWNLSPVCCRVETGDASSYKWKGQLDFVASETYLGRPFTSQPSSEVLAQTISECNVIIKKFLKNLHGQLKSGTRLCLAVPAWQVETGSFKHLPVIDSLKELGYNRVKFKHAEDKDLIYFREDQIVARQLLIITKE